MLRVWLIGHLAVEWNGVALPPPAAERARALLGYLALHPGAQPRSEIAGALWPGAPDDAARASLRTALWSLGRSLDPYTDTLIDAGRSAIEIVAQPIWVDALSDDPPEGRLLAGIDDDWA